MDIYRKGNTATILLIVSVLVATAGLFAWLFMKNPPAPDDQKISDRQIDPGSDDKKSGKGRASGGIAYKIGNRIVAYDLDSRQEKTIYSSDKLIDFDLSRDGKYLAYSMKGDGFSGNSDIYFLDTESQKTVRLTEENNMASSSPKIYSGGKKVAYLRRTFDAKMGKLRDGEIWTIDANGDQETSAKLYGEESKSWFELDPKERCCTCDADEKPYEPESMLQLEDISENGDLIGFRKGSFDIYCFAGFLMESGVYDSKTQKVLDGMEILPAADGQYYAFKYAQFPSDPNPFCISNTFFSKNGEVIWNPDKSGSGTCQSDYYYDPLDFEAQGGRVDMLYLKQADGVADLSRVSLINSSFSTGTNIKGQLTEKNSSGVLYESDNIIAANKIGDYVAILEYIDGSAYPTMRILNMSTKTVEKTVKLDNYLGFEAVLVD